MANKMTMLKKSFKGLQFFMLPDKKIKEMNFNGKYILCEVLELKDLFKTKNGIELKSYSSDIPLIFGEIIKSNDEEYEVGKLIIYTSSLFTFRYYVPLEDQNKVYIQVKRDDILLNGDKK